MNSTSNSSDQDDSARAKLALFKDPAFRAVWLSGLTASTTRWLEMLAVAVYAFEISGSPLVVAILTLLRMLPLALFGAISGAIAERFDRRLFLLHSQTMMIVSSLILALLAWLDIIQLWHLAISAFLNGIFWTTDMPARRTLLGDIVGHEKIGAAMAFDSVTSNGTRMVGPLLGGLLLELIGLHGTFLLSAGFYVLGWIFTARLQHQDPPRVSAEQLKIFSSIVEGLHYTRTNRALAGTLVVTIIFNLWGFPFTSMVPVIGKEVLGLSPFPVGLLASMEGAGAVTGAIMLAFMAQARWYRKLYFYGTFLYIVMVIAFAQASVVFFSSFLLNLVGFAGAAFSTMQSVLVFLSAPPEVRRRIMGLLSVCIGTGPIGFLHLGILADWLGAPLAMTIMGVEGLIALIFAYWYWPEIR